MQRRRRMAVQMIDIGANLTDPVFQGLYRGKQRHEPDLPTILARAKTCGVEKIVVTGGNLAESRKAVQLVRDNSSDAFPRLFATVGVHPTRCNEFEAEGKTPDSYFAELLAVCEQGKEEGIVVAIGECGLDYDRLEFCDKETQLKYFEKQFQLAEQTHLPLFLHNRNTGGDFYGGKDEMFELAKLGLYIGVNGCSLKTEENLDCVKAIPLERLVIETGTADTIRVEDAPWCDIRSTHAGHSYVETSWQSKKAEKYAPDCLVKGRNEPCTLIQVLEVISHVRSESREDIAANVFLNAERVFFSK